MFYDQKNQPGNIISIQPLTDFVEEDENLVKSFIIIIHTLQRLSKDATYYFCKEVNKNHIILNDLKICTLYLCENIESDRHHKKLNMC